MCSPFYALGAQVGGAISSTIGSYYGAQSKKSELNLRADLNEITAQGVIRSGQREEQRSRLSTAQLKSTQRANLAANGVALGEGSALNLQTSTDVLGEADAQTIRSNALRSAWGYRTEASMQRASASAISPFMEGASSLLGGASKVADTWYRFKRDGVFDSGPSGAGGLTVPGWG